MKHTWLWAFAVSALVAGALPFSANATQKQGDGEGGPDQLSDGSSWGTGYISGIETQAGDGTNGTETVDVSDPDQTEWEESGEMCPGGLAPQCVVCGSSSVCSVACVGGYTCKMSIRYRDGVKIGTSCASLVNCSTT
jgi:hypothetical protein